MYVLKDRIPSLEIRTGVKTSDGERTFAFWRHGEIECGASGANLDELIRRVEVLEDEMSEQDRLPTMD